MKKKKQKNRAEGTHEHGTANQRKRLVESQMRSMAEASASVTGGEKITYLEGPFGARRKAAILNYLNRAEKEFASFGLASAAESFVTNEVRSFNNYNHLDSEHDIGIGAALWMLDKLRASGALGGAYALLPDIADNPDAWCLPTDFSHPCYESDLIQSVVHLLSKRYDGERDEIITQENARGHRPSEGYTALLALLPRDDVEKACETFKSKVWELAARNMRGQAYYEKHISRVSARISSHPLEQRRTGAAKVPFADPQVPKLDDFPGIAQRNQSKMASLREAHSLSREGLDLMERERRYKLDFEKYLMMDYDSVRRETGSREVAEALAGFAIDDPYELCFALFCLIDSGDDAPWLMKSGSALMVCTVQLLPWYVDQSDWDEEQYNEWYDGLTYNWNGWVSREAPPEQVDFLHERFQGKTLAQIIYGLCRCVIPTGLHPFEAERQQLISDGMDEEKAQRLTDAAEQMFLHAFQAKQYRGAWDDEIEEIEEETTENPPSTPVKISGYWGKVAAEQGTALVPPEEDVAEELNRVREELAQAKKKLKSLRTALNTEKRGADAERAKYERELKELRMEHRELADLRTLVFNQENEVREKPVQGFSFPYETRKRTVVFGGHDTFLKAIKPMLPTVKFVNAAILAFNPEIIRNADVVWIQNNCMSHSQYWSVVKHCKLSSVQMRYFGFASAEKCAEQLVTEDLKKYCSGK